jgi:hypothetical protein
LESHFQTDCFGSLMSLLLECPNSLTRLNVGFLLKSILGDLKVFEEDYLYEEEAENKVALSSRFVSHVLSQLNSMVAKNWFRMSNIFDMLCFYGAGCELPTVLSLPKPSDKVFNLLGMEYLFQH